MIYIMKKIIFTFLIMLLLLSPISADKIQKNETWQYYDEARKVTINETALEIVQLDASRKEYIAAVKVNTTRGYQFPYDLAWNLLRNSYNMEFTFNLKSTNDGLLYVSQEGGLPLITDRHFDGGINFKISNTTWENSLNLIVDHEPRWRLEGVPSSAFASAETTSYAINLFLDYDEGTFVYKQWYIITTNQAVTEKTRNYTITTTDYEVSWLNTTDKSNWYVSNRVDEISWSFPITNTTIEQGYILNPSLSLSQIADEAMQLTWDSELKLPTNITQTEPVIIQGLSLNQFETQIVSYILVDDGLSSGVLNTEDDSPLIFISIPIIILIVFYRSYKKKHY